MSDQDILISILSALNAQTSYAWTLNELPIEDSRQPAATLVPRESSNVIRKYKDGGAVSLLDFELHIISQAPDSLTRNNIIEDLNDIGQSLTITLGSNKRLDKFEQTSNPALYRSLENGQEEYSASYQLHWKRG